ncbi:YtpI-like protein [Gracilibacillus ureilyticus]|uniref:YtpI-like protein n=1 Tax=Gracilibacillus ureilyticus TaxID=531814 RepID=A0A1H9UDC4_9BACI|nr:YtpI family protein [Gracilibacillus ureilyticus]SES07455.1 YtpI-like protein [Gracilibacillus ureilyticus]
MVIFPIVIVVSFILYVYYKVMIIRSADPLIQEITNAKARLSLGFCISFFGVNQYLFYETQLALFIAILFFIIGGLQGYAGWKRYHHYKSEFNKRETASV